MTDSPADRRFSRRTLVAGLGTGLVVLAAGPALAHRYRHGTLSVEHPTVTPTRGAATVNAGFMMLVNRGRSGDRLVSASSPNAARIELHTHERVDGMMRMRPVAGGIALPAGRTVTLAPGGLHLMIFEPTAPLQAGGRFPLTLVFERAGPLAIEAEIVAPAPGGHRH